MRLNPGDSITAVTLPCIDAQGVIRVAYYAKDQGDHLPFEQAKAFALACIEANQP